jgi:eukaryotic-like serine/threonine-protein kinase
MLAPDPRIGTVLHNRYRILERMGEGAMGVVYRGERVQLGRPVAIKFLRGAYASSAEGKRLFQLEALASSRLAHPNCVPVTDFGVEGNEPYLVMDFVHGQPLDLALRAELRFAPKRAVSVVRQVLAALAHAHAQGVIHRDVKPENIILTRTEGHGEQPRLLDFGLGKLRGEESVLSGVAPGTPAYLSPELASGERVDERADIYAVGTMLFELLTGQKPFYSAVLAEMLQMHRHQPPPTVKQVAPELEISEALEAALQRALAKDRNQRFSSAAEFLQAIEATPEGGAVAATHWKRPLLFVALGLLVIAAGVVGAML